MVFGCSAINNNTNIDNGSQKANVCIITENKEPAPIYDKQSNKVVGYGYKGFAISIDSQKDGKGYFSLPINNNTSPDSVITKEFYIPMEYLEKGYKEPFAVIEIISLDMILLKENAAIYDDKGNVIVKITDKFGPIRFIQKTEKGYQFVMGFNLLYVKEKDVELIKYKY